MNLLFSKGLVLVVIAVALLSGCAAPVVYKPVVMAPKAKGMASVNTLAITSVKGRSGYHYNGSDAVIRGKLASFLSGISAPGKPGFNVVDNHAIDSVIAQQKVSENGMFDANTSVRLGKLLGADAILNANYQVSNVFDQRYKSEYTDYETCVQYKKDGKECRKYKTREEYCTKRSISVELLPSVVSVTTGGVIYANNYASQQTSSKCPSRGDTLSSVDTLVNQGFNRIFSDMRKDVYFYEIVLTLKMIEQDGSDMPKVAKQSLSTAMELVEQGLVERACAQVARAAASYNQSPAILYNMGICKELNSETEVARAFFERALDYSALLGRTDRELVYTAIKRMEGTADLDNHNEEQKTFSDIFR